MNPSRSVETQCHYVDTKAHLSFFSAPLDDPSSLYQAHVFPVNIFSSSFLRPLFVSIFISGLCSRADGVITEIVTGLANDFFCWPPSRAGLCCIAP